MTSKHINVPDGFANTAEAFRRFLANNHLTEAIQKQLASLDTETFSNLPQVGSAIRQLMLQGRIPGEIEEAILAAYRELGAQYSYPIQVAVRSSATAEDLPDASFAGQHESYLNIAGEVQLLDACRRCFASLFTDRAIKYRHDHGFDQSKIYLSVGVQKMVRSDKASAGVCFTLDPESGFDRRHLPGLPSDWKPVEYTVP